MQELFVFTFEQSRSDIEIITVRLYEKHGTKYKSGKKLTFVYGAMGYMEEQ